MMKITIFGATGFIGKYLVEALLKKNHEIIVFTRYEQKAQHLFGSNVKIIEWDGVSEDVLIEIAFDSDAIINLAGENISSKPWTSKQKFKILQSRSQLGTTITNTLLKSPKKPEVFVQASAIGYYGPSVISDSNEEIPKGVGFLASVTEAWENSTSQIQNMGIRYIVIRTGVVLGYDGGLLSKLIKPIKYFFGSYFGKGNQWISWIHVEDEVRAIEYLLENDKTKGTYNLSAPKPARLKTIVKLLGKKIKRPVWIAIPPFIIRLLFKDLGKEILLASQRVVPKRLNEIGFKFKYDKIESAIENLFKPVKVQTKNQ